MNYHTSEIATGGMCVALTVAIMFAVGLVPNLEYAIPMIASYLITVVVLELGGKWAWMVYVSTALLGMILVPAKSSVIAYIIFFGYYPIAKKALESKFSRFWECLFKFLIFNVSMVGEFVVSIKLFGVPLDEFKTHLAYVLLVFGNAVFVFYDFALTKLIRVYLLVWQSYVHKFIKH